MTGRMRSSSPSLRTVARSAPYAVKMRLGLAVTTMSVLAFMRSPIVRALARAAACWAPRSRGVACSACAAHSTETPATTMAHSATAPARASSLSCMFNMCLPLADHACFDFAVSGEAPARRRNPVEADARLAPPCAGLAARAWLHGGNCSARESAAGALALTAPEHTGGPTCGCSSRACLPLETAFGRIDRTRSVLANKRRVCWRNCSAAAGAAAPTERYHMQEFGFGLFMAHHG